ncbi:MAG TPA: hypothetical protein DIW31_06800 [Bacteroidales bacterium]|nr:hypothetical protein [Bacteroidales bacterium]
MKYKNIIYIIVLTSLILSCSKPKYTRAKDSTNTYGIIDIDIKQTEKFYDLMNYLEKKSPTGFNNLSTKPDKEKIESNFNDKVLINKIDSLTSLPIYRKFEKISISWVNKKRYSGKKSYKMAFMYLPFKQINMTAGMPEMWVRFWQNGLDKNVKPLLNYISSNREEFLRKVINKTNIYLPSEAADSTSKTNIFICIDGNRGSFQWDNNIVMDLLYYNNFDTSAFTNTLCHELHHRYYVDWLNKNAPLKGITSKQRVLKAFQISLIEEGVAQQFNFVDKNEQSKTLYNNRQLIEELFNKLVALIREIETQKNIKKWYKTQSRQEFDYSMSLLKKYSPNGYDFRTIPNRPSITYYISYHLYNSIYESGGYDKLKYVIENPKELLNVYNSIYTPEFLIPKIPEDIVNIWRGNFRN